MDVSGGGLALNTALSTATEDIVITDSLSYTTVSWANPLDITVSAAEGQTPSIDGLASAAAVVIQSTAGNVTISGVSMTSDTGDVIQTNASWHGALIVNGVLEISTTSSTKYGVRIGAGAFTGSILFSNSIMPSSGQGGLVYGSQCLDLRVDGCSISGCTAAPIRLDYWGGWVRESRLAIASTSGVWGPNSGFFETRQVGGEYPDISNNLITVDGGKLGVVMRDLTAGDQPAVDNNTFILGTNAVAVYSDPATASIDAFSLRNNIFSGGSYAWRANASVTVTHENNCYYDQTAGTHEHTGDPLDLTEIEDAPGLDPMTYAPLAGSVCIDAGQNTGRTPDLIGTHRPQGTAYDIGCFEYIPPDDTPTTWSTPTMRVYLDGSPVDTVSMVPHPSEPDGLSVIRMIWMSLVCHRRAESDDPMIESGDPVYRGGWAGDAIFGGSWGSRIWLIMSYYRGEDRPSLLSEAAYEALQPLIDDGLLTDVAVDTTEDGTTASMSLTVTTSSGSTYQIGFDPWEGVTS